MAIPGNPMQMPPPPGMGGDAGAMAPAIGDPEATGPVPGPMATPEPKEGLRQSAMVNVQMAIDLLTQSLPAIGSTTEEGQSILNAVKSLTRKFGKSEAKSKELVPAEILQMIRSLPQAGGATPEAKAMMAAPIPGTQTPPTPM